MPRARPHSTSAAVEGATIGWRRATPVRLVVALSLAMLAASAPDASGVIVHLRSGKTLSFQPLRGASTGSSASSFDEFFSNLDYNGGPVMASNTNYAVYWRPPGAKAYPADYRPGVNRYLEDLAHDSGGHENVDSVASQYNDAAGEFATYNSIFGGALIDETPYPTNGCAQATICLTDEQLREELRNYVAAHKLPHDLAHEYFLLTPPEVEDCFSPAGTECSAGSKKPTYCAYHSVIHLAEGEIVYSNDPYVTGNGGCDDGIHPNGSTSDGVLEGGLSHEHNESITDPEPNNAWFNFSTNKENGDQCRTFTAESEFGTPLGKAPNGAKYNQVVNGHLYWYQQEWSNQTNRCLQRLTFSGEEPTATFTSEPGAANEVTFNATGSTAGPGVLYSWQFNPAGPATPEETKSLTVKRKFPSAGTYTVALTVFTENGTSIGTARAVPVGDEGPTAAFAVKTPSPAVGVPVEFNGSGSIDPDGSIVGYSWNFGDGSPAGTGERPTHTYASAGTHTVALTVTDSSGLSGSVSHFVVLAKGPQAIKFTSAAPGSASVGGPTYAVSAAGGGSANAVIFTINPASSSVCSISGANVSFIGVGTCTIDANQAGNANYEAAPQQQQSFTVARGSQAITFTSTAPAPAAVGGPPYTVSAAGGGSGNAVIFTINSASSSVCSIAGASVSFRAPGTCTIDANQAGNAAYEAAPEARQAVQVVWQIITFTSTSPSSATVGGPSYNVTATATSGLPVAFSTGTPSVCNLAGSTVSFGAVGTCVIDANQAGNGEYGPAPEAQQSVTVGPAPTMTPALGSACACAPLAGLTEPAPSNLSARAPVVKVRNGAITITVSVGEAGMFSWLLSFQNGKFGVFAARNTRCRSGFRRLRGRCRPSMIVFAKGTATVAAAGRISFMAKPSASALRALKNASKHHRGLPVTVTLTFRPAHRAGPLTRTESIMVRLRKK